MVTKGYGLTVDDIDWSCPADLEPYAKAHNIETVEQDNLMWAWWGNYGLSAVSVAVEHNLEGQKAKSKYIEKPMLQDYIEKEREARMSEEEKKRKTEQLFMQLRIMGANFNLNHQEK